MAARSKLVILAVALAAAVGLPLWLSGQPAAPSAPAPSSGHTASTAGRPAHLATTTAPPRTTTATTCTNTAVLSRWTDSRLALLTIVVPAEEGDVAAARAEVRAGAGGLILFGSQAPTDLARQLASLRQLVPGHLGLLVMTDEEGGGVQRMANLVGSLPWAAWMGSHWTPGEIKAAVTKVGRRMRAAGVGMDLAPVLDVDGRNVPPGPSDPDGWRSFSGSTAVVSADGVAYMKGLMAAGEIPVVKHFPGLGGASGNTDVQAARTLPWSTLVKVALPPYLKAFSAKAPAVMVSNAVVPGLSKFPASLSPAVIAKELVSKLGFHGLVMTDSLSAKAIQAAGFSVAAAAVQALEAGADMVMFNMGASPAATTNQTVRVESAIVAAVKADKLPRHRLVSAARAVLGVRHVSLCG